EETELVRSLSGLTLSDVMGRARSKDFCSAVLALVELGVLETAGVSLEARRASTKAVDGQREPDRLDDEALRSRIAARRALVDEGDYFALLGVSRGATGYDVRRAYTELREQLDPARVLTAATVDLRDDVDAILAVLDEAYEILSDDLRRERYRRALEAAPV
ncbi:MAG TPA: DnaJ domain-containing protein, partial [Polyangiaceae bacterium]|nr:DnaJ domain-containing protein [Polyangiaceae bacterium]